MWPSFDACNMFVKSPAAQVKCLVWKRILTSSTANYRIQDDDSIASTACCREESWLIVKCMRLPAFLCTREVAIYSLTTLSCWVTSICHRCGKEWKKNEKSHRRFFLLVVLRSYLTIFCNLKNSHFLITMASISSNHASIMQLILLCIVYYVNYEKLEKTTARSLFCEVWAHSFEICKN